MPYSKNHLFLLFLIVAAFLAREFFLAASFPLFTGQDESRHYNSIQWISKEQDARCLRKDLKNDNQDKENLATYRFTEEIRETSSAANLSIWREENYRKPLYPSGKSGSNELLIQNNSWTKNTPCPPDIVPAVNDFSFFHWLGNIIERVWSESDILTRFYLVRIFSVLLGTATLLFAYLAAKEGGFSYRTSLLITLILSLQPRLSIYTTNINYDTLLIPAFTFFTWAGLRCLQRGFSLLNISLLVAAFLSATLTKGTGLALLGGILFLAIFALLQKRDHWKKLPLSYWLISGALMLAVLLFLNNAYTFSRLLPDFSVPSLIEYLGKSLPRIPSSSENFWGTMSWNESNLGPIFVYFIWCIEALVLLGLIRFFTKKDTLSFLPSRTTLLFCLTLLLSLQLGVRFHDWHVFQETGQLLLGTPGRYFLPTLLPQLLLIAIGLGALLRKKIWLERSLILFALIMLAFNLYTVWLIIIPRFYL